MAALLLWAFQALCHSAGIPTSAAEGNIGLDGADYWFETAETLGSPEKTKGVRRRLLMKQRMATMKLTEVRIPPCVECLKSEERSTNDGSLWVESYL